MRKNGAVQGNHKHREQDTEEQMKRHAAGPVFPLNGKSPPEPEYGRCQERTDVHSCEPRQRKVPPGGRVVRKEFPRKVLAKQEQAEKCPSEKNDDVGAQLRREDPSHPASSLSHRCGDRFRVLTNGTISVVSRRVEKDLRDR